MTARRKVATWAGVALAILLAGCSASALAKKVAPPDVQAASEEAMVALRAHRFDDLAGKLDASLGGRDNTAAFRQMASFVPPDGELGSHIAAYSFQTGTGGAQYDITYEYQFEHTWVVARFLWRRLPAGLRLAGFHVRSQADSLEEQNAFSLRGLRPPQVLVLIVGPLMALLSLYALVRCIRTPGLPRKWLWILFILVGIGGFNIHWSTGEWKMALLEFRLLSFSAFAPAGQPWVLTASVPVGAVVFLHHRRKRKASATRPSP